MGHAGGVCPGFKRGVSGYINQTVPAAIFCWLRWRGDFRAAVEAIVCAGGDTVSTGAVVGGLVGATAGVESLPADWLAGLCDWPRTQHWIRDLGTALAERGVPRRFFWPDLAPRNL